jgi:hypothetical protein
MDCVFLIIHFFVNLRAPNKSIFNKNKNKTSYSNLETNLYQSCFILSSVSILLCTNSKEYCIKFYFISIYNACFNWMLCLTKNNCWFQTFLYPVPYISHTGWRNQSPREKNNINSYKSLFEQISYPPPKCHTPWLSPLRSSYFFFAFVRTKARFAQS